MTGTACAMCFPPVTPGLPRLHEGHVSVRFRDMLRGDWTITLDGVDVTVDCYEANAGESGWVVLFDRQGQLRFPCSVNHNHARASLHFGHVTVQVQPRHVA